MRSQEKMLTRLPSKVKSSVLKPGGVLVPSLTPCGGPGKLRSHWEDIFHTVVCQMSKEIPVYELRSEIAKGRSRFLHLYLLLPCDHLPLETLVKHPDGLLNIKCVIALDMYAF